MRRQTGRSAAPRAAPGTRRRGSASIQRGSLAAVGGGSAIDTAKCIALLRTNGGHPRDWEDFGALRDDPLSVLALRYACAASGFAGPDELLGAVGGFMVARWFCPVLVAGGSKSLANALFRAAASAGATCHVSARVTRMGHVGPGFQLSCADGRQVRARNVICTLDPRTTFTGLLDPALVPPRAGRGGPRLVLRRAGLLHRALRHRRAPTGRCTPCGSTPSRR